MEDAGTFIASNLRSPTTGRIDNLRLSGEDYLPSTIDAATIIRRFPQVSSLHIDSISNTVFFEIIPSITELCIKDATNISLWRLARVFPSVETLTLWRVRVGSSSTDVVRWSKLRKLNLPDCLDIPWEHLRTTHLNHLLFWGNVDERVMSFIASLKSLESLDISYTKEHVYSIATSAPQLHHLSIDPCEEITDLTKMELNKLTSLSVYDLKENNLRLELFEKIVGGRLLPKKTGKKSAKKEPLSLQILVKDIPWEDLEWHGSELISSARQEVSEVKRAGGVFTEYRFTWKETSQNSM